MTRADWKMWMGVPKKRTPLKRVFFRGVRTQAGEGGPVTQGAW